MSRRRIMQSQGHSNELPSGYKIVKYLESSGKQNINTGVPLNNEQIKVKLDLELPIINPSANKMLFGVNSITDNQTHSYFQIYLANNGNLYMNCGRPYYTTDLFIASADLHRTEVFLSSGNSAYEVSAFGEKRSGMCDKFRDLNNPIYLFCRNILGEAYNHANYKLYNCIIEENSKTTRNFIPALDSTGKPCMFDKVTQQPFYNHGTGEFGYKLLNGTYVAPV